MEYKPRHSQPFTLEQAVLLDVPTITAEIARLQNSLAHLRDTQLQLQEHVDTEGQPDAEILQALEENKLVIASQDERISMLRLALEHKGLASHTNPHYDPHRPSERHREETRDLVGEPADSGDDLGVTDGVYL